MLWDAHHRDASRVDSFYRSHAAWDMTRWGDFLAASRALATTIRNNDAAAATARGMFFSLPSYYKARNANGLDLRDAADVLGGLSDSTVRAGRRRRPGRPGSRARRPHHRSQRPIPGAADRPAPVRRAAGHAARSGRAGLPAAGPRLVTGHRLGRAAGLPGRARCPPAGRQFTSMESVPASAQPCAIRRGWTSRPPIPRSPTRKRW